MISLLGRRSDHRHGSPAPWGRPRAPLPCAPVRLAALRAFRQSVLPDVDREVSYWQSKAQADPDPRVRMVAIDSLRAKRFHCEGGAILALLVPDGPERGAFVRAVCAIQTLSDVLDSLTDRPPDALPLRPSEILALHGAFVAAVTGLGLESGDSDGLSGGSTSGSHASPDPLPVYVKRLVAAAAANLRRLPRLDEARPFLLRLSLTYSVMQSLKQGPRAERRRALAGWARRVACAGPGPGPRPWAEVTACAGSTLGMFRLLAWAATRASADPQPPERALARYHPSLCALHILLDGAIDLEEDAAADDLNVFRALTETGSAPGPLGDLLASAHHVGALAQQARRDLRGDPLGSWLVEGLLAAYLADPKVRSLPVPVRRCLTGHAGWRAWVIRFWIHRQTRRGLLGDRLPQLAQAPAAAWDPPSPGGGDTTDPQGRATEPPRPGAHPEPS